MLMYIYTVRDAAVSAYGNPFSAINVGHATRSFMDQVNDPQSGTLFNHTSDFELFELGTFDDQTALYDLHKVPKSICTAASLKKQPKTA